MCAGRIASACRTASHIYTVIINLPHSVTCSHPILTSLLVRSKPLLPLEYFKLQLLAISPLAVGSFAFPHTFEYMQALILPRYSSASFTRLTNLQSLDNYTDCTAINNTDDVRKAKAWH